MCGGVRFPKPKCSSHGARVQNRISQRSALAAIFKSNYGEFATIKTTESNEMRMMRGIAVAAAIAASTIPSTACVESAPKKAAPERGPARVVRRQPLKRRLPLTSEDHRKVATAELKRQRKRERNLKFKQAQEK